MRGVTAPVFTIKLQLEATMRKVIRLISGLSLGVLAVFGVSILSPAPATANSAAATSVTAQSCDIYMCDDELDECPFCCCFEEGQIKPFACGYTCHV